MKKNSIMKLMSKMVLDCELSVSYCTISIFHILSYTFKILLNLNLNTFKILLNVFSS